MLPCIYSKYRFLHHIFGLKCLRFALAQPQLADSLTLSLLHTHTGLFPHKHAKEDSRLTDVQACGCSCIWCTQARALPWTQLDMPDAKVKKLRLLSRGVPALLPMLHSHSHSICSALINQGRGGQGVATRNKAWSSRVVQRTTSWHSAKLFLSCVLPNRLQGYTAC